MGARRHGGLGIRVCKLRKLVYARLEHRQERAASCPQQVGVAEVIDVLRGGAEMHQLEGSGGSSSGRELLAYVVLHGLDVVVDPRLDALDGCRRALIGGLRKLLGPLAHLRAECRAGKLRNGGAEMQEPLRLDADALADQPSLRQQAAQWLGGGTVAPIDGRKRLERRQAIAGASGHALLS
jgi:hypothetical protein